MLCYQLWSVIVTLLTLLTLVRAQDDFGGGDDAGGGDLDMESMLGGQDGAAKTTANPNAVKPTFQVKTILEESLSAMQQLGFIIGRYKNEVPKCRIDFN